MRIAVIGSGISGIAAAHVLQKNGHEVVVYEKRATVGGVWGVAYPGVRLQNIGSQYHISDYPWPFEPDFNPTGAQILRYLRSAVDALNLDVRLEHEVRAAEERADGWTLRIVGPDGQETREEFGFVLSAIGQYTEGKVEPRFADQDKFQGALLTERDVRDLDAVMVGKRVVVVGFGKSAVDMVALALPRAASVEHVFRTPRYLIPPKILGLHYTHMLFTRVNTVMMTSWDHPTAGERFLHRRLRFLVRGFWKLLQTVVRAETGLHRFHRDPARRRRMATLTPAHTLMSDLRSAGALEPVGYYKAVARGDVEPHHAEVLGFTAGGVRIRRADDGAEQLLECDVCVMALGAKTPAFPFLPDRYRELAERHEDGVQLYRHVIHPRIPRFAFAGYNHGFLHVASAEIAAQWIAAVLDGDLPLPSAEVMEASIERIRAWKREHINFEPSRSCAVNTRFQQYNDMMLRELGVSPYRKLPNPVFELFQRYYTRDYSAVFEDYQRGRAARSGPLAIRSMDA